MAGRTLMFEHSHQIGVVVAIEDYRLLRRIVSEKRVAEPNFTMGDLMRDYIHRGLKEDRRRVAPPPNRRESRIRQLRTIARIVQELERSA